MRGGSLNSLTCDFTRKPPYYSHIDESTAQQQGRSTNVIRDYKHRNVIKTRETKTTQQLKQEKQMLAQRNREPDHSLKRLEKRKDEVKQALQIEEKLLDQKLETITTKKTRNQNSARASVVKNRFQVCFLNI